MNGQPAATVVALDVGGTAMKGVVLDTATQSREVRRWETPREQGPEAVIEQALRAVDELCALAPDAQAVGLVVPGVVDEETGVAAHSENIEWHDVPFRRLVAERTGLPVGFGHDVRAGGLAEHELGAAAGCDDVLFVPIGTGIAGAMFVHGHLVHHPYAGEIGHVHAGFDEPCACGAVGCLEAIASGAAVARRYARRAGSAVSAEEVVRRAGRGDPDASAVWDDALDALARVLTAYVSILAPQRVVVGGGVSRAGERLLGPLRTRLRELLVWQQEPEVVAAVLADEAGSLGAGLLARRALAQATPDVVPRKERQGHPVTENAKSGPLGRHTSEEVASQPSCWKIALAQGRERPAGLPADGERVLVLGCGTSYYLGAAYAWLREAAGSGLTDALIASEVPTRLRAYDRVVVISRSGTTKEVLQAFEKMPAGTPVTAIVGELGTPVADAASEVVDLSYADEHSVVQTRFPTSLLTLLRAHLGESPEALSGLVDEAAAVIAGPVTETAPRQLVVLGSGWAAALAQEAALKCRESAGMWAEAYATGEYRHGPISVAGPGTLVWAMTPLSDQLVGALDETGAKVHHGSHDPQVELVALQLQAVSWATASGRDPDVPIHLSRSVVTP